MSDLYDRIERAAAMLRGRIGIEPRVGIILGTGLGELARKVEKAVTVPYEEIPEFPTSTVQSHAGQIVAGTLSGQPAMLMEGRFHFYEGYSLDQVTFPVRVMKALGCTTLIVTNACGGINPQYDRGDLMLIEDHLNLMGVNPLIGPNDERLGPRFPDMYQPYCAELLARAEAVALQKGIRTRKGVYSAMTGPCLETRAEYRMLKILGADTIGMSTVPEVIVATHGGMKVLGISVVTDMCLPDALAPVNIDEIIATAGEAGPKLEEIILGVLEGATL